jgi:hypothetical protein
MSCENATNTDVGRPLLDESLSTALSFRVPAGVLVGSHGLGGGGSYRTSLLAIMIGDGCFSNPPGILGMNVVSDIKVVL